MGDKELHLSARRIEKLRREISDPCPDLKEVIIRGSSDVVDVLLEKLLVRMELCKFEYHCLNSATSWDYWNTKKPSL
ncbi:hypothetical protein BGX33_000047 [Mortierella sp. NVP41]|nr:hypothetical protein BGX33_000047 [Mortierella sp. NVP41]